MAQSNVYSLNIVGYVNQSVVHGAFGGFTFTYNPLSVGTNGAQQVIPNDGRFDGCEILEWTGTGFKATVFDSLTDDTPTGFTDRGGNPVAPPPLTSGKGWYFNNTAGPNIVSNITFVGDVRTGTNTINVPVSNRSAALGSPLPLGGGVSSVLGLSNPTGALDGCEVLKATYTGNGAINGYIATVYDSLTDDTSTGFTDRGGNQVAEPNIALGEGFLFNNLTANPVTWRQVLNIAP